MMKEFQNKGYNDIFIPNLMILSPQYGEYKKALDSVNDRICRELGLHYYIMILTSTSSSESNDHRVCQEKCVNYLISSFTNVNSHPISPLLKAKAEHALALDFFVFLLICSDIC